MHVHNYWTRYFATLVQSELLHPLRCHYSFGFQSSFIIDHQWSPSLRIHQWWICSCEREHHLFFDTSIGEGSQSIHPLVDMLADCYVFGKQSTSPVVKDQTPAGERYSLSRTYWVNLPSSLITVSLDLCIFYLFTCVSFSTVTAPPRPVGGAAEAIRLRIISRALRLLVPSRHEEAKTRFLVTHWFSLSVWWI